MTTSAPPLAAELPHEERPDAAVLADDAAYRALVERLSRQSVAKHYDAYQDVPWDDPAYAIDPADPRWELSALDPLGATAWYRALPQPLRARFGLELIASFAKIGSQFENVLQRGLLEFALRLPNGAPEYRYCMHEVIEEGQHSLMFQEFVNRTGLLIPGMPAWMQLGARMVVRLGRTFPELFFLFVLGGEDPIDHVQREQLRTGQFAHPLVRRISQVHITEEARHLSFARAYLRRHVPRLGTLKRTLLRIRTPLLFGQMARVMMEPTPAMIARYGIPKAVLREAYRSPAALAQRVAALRKPRELCVELGIAVPPFDRLWRRMGIWDDPA
ncbi:MAG: diiron oxygenase [Proteobacteria bacterium]|nr:MAG: diiron oxygenase [Pseudomonadota bacterium]